MNYDFVFTREGKFTRGKGKDKGQGKHWEHRRPSPHTRTEADAWDDGLLAGILLLIVGLGTAVLVFVIGAGTISPCN